MLTEEKIREAIEASGVSSGAGEISATQHFTEIGFDSLDIFNILVEVETMAGIKIPDEDVAGLRSIEDIVKYLATR